MRVARSVGRIDSMTRRTRSGLAASRRRPSAIRSAIDMTLSSTLPPAASVRSDSSKRTIARTWPSSSGRDRIFSSCATVSMKTICESESVRMNAVSSAFVLG